jgi:hypothetical protein
LGFAPIIGSVVWRLASVAPFRISIDALNLDLHDVRADPTIHGSQNYTRSQTIAKDLRDDGLNGTLYRSVRCPG